MHVNLYFCSHKRVESAAHIDATHTGHHITVFVDSGLDKADKGFLDICVSTSSKAVDVSECFMAVITQRAFSTVIMGAVVTH